MIKIQDEVIVLDHPIIDHNLAVLRDINYNPESFRQALKRVSDLLFFQATQYLPTVKKEIQTPNCATTVNVLDPCIDIILAPIMRAGMVFCDVAQDLLPTAKVQHLGMYRDEETLTPVWYYNKTLKINDPEKTHVFILDPMLATGNSAYDAVLCYVEKNIPLENIFFICLIAAPQGIKRLTDNFKGLKILTANVDASLNSKGYIIPGLGDAGDKIYNT